MASTFPIKAEFLDFGTTDILDGIILCSGEHPAHCRMFSKIQGLWSLGVSNACLLARTSKNTTVSRYPKCLLGGKVTPCLEPCFLKQIINTTDLWFKSSTNYIPSTFLHQTCSLFQPGKPIFDPWHASKLPLTHVPSLFHKTQTLPAGSKHPFHLHIPWPSRQMQSLASGGGLTWTVLLALY